jgi:DnaJ-class molecular chaperone
MGVVIIILIVVVGFIYYRLSLKSHPFTACKACGGRGRFYHPFFPDAFGLCKKCGGNGRQKRLGVRLFRGRRER